jgi:hypothetical protein
LHPIQDSRVRRHLQFANQIDNLTATHRLHRGERNRVFARCCEKPGFFDKSKLGSKDCGKNQVSDCCGGSKKPGFFDKLKREVKIVAKTCFLILGII